MADRRRYKRALWGIAPAEAEHLLAEQEAPLLRERELLERAVALAESEAERLAADCQHLGRQIGYAEQRLRLARQTLERQRSLPPARALALHQHLRALEREHLARMEELRRREAQLRAQIDERRRSLHRWTMELLRSVADRG